MYSSSAEMSVGTSFVKIVRYIDKIWNSLYLFICKLLTFSGIYDKIVFVVNHSTCNRFHPRRDCYA
jgi:hypothetical protein